MIPRIAEFMNGKVGFEDGCRALGAAMCLMFAAMCLMEVAGCS